MKRFRLRALLLLTASLLGGFAVRAQSADIVQSERVAYALTLIDAGEDGTNTSATGGVVTEDTKKVRIKVTVSVPRSSNTYGSIPTYASPSRIMFRKHKGDATAFDGTITLTRDAPYAKDGTSATTSYYPMPQIDPPTYLDAVPLLIVDPTQLNYAAVKSGSSTNVKGETVADYLGLGMAHDMARWEATYLSAAFTVSELMASDETTLAANQRFIRALLNGDATYEWFIASSRGLGSAARISEIQDLGRNLTCTDVRLWVPIGETSTAIDADSQVTLGAYNLWTLNAMSRYVRAEGDDGAETLDDSMAAWKIYYGAPGSNFNASAGVQLFNTKEARLESPTYPDGVSSISFKAFATTLDETEDATLKVQYCTENASTWQDLKTITLSNAAKNYTVDCGGKLRANTSARFRLVRGEENTAVGAVNLQTYVIRDILVRSEAPAATFGSLNINNGITPHQDKDFSMQVKVTADASKAPRGYEGKFQLRRRAKDDSKRSWYVAPAAIEGVSDAVFTATFTPGTLLQNDDGTLNVKEDAFFTDVDDAVTGVLAGVYDVRVVCDLLGSFEAGRDDINGYETVEQTLSTYTQSVTDEDGMESTVEMPYVLDVREQAMTAETVFARVMVLSGSSSDNAALYTFDVPLLPSSKRKNVWRVDLSKTLTLPDDLSDLAGTDAVYAWGDETGAYKKGYLSFRLCAQRRNTSTDAIEETWYGQNATVNAGKCPSETTVIPAVAETLLKADKETDAVPLLVSIAKLTNSHLMVELDFTDPDAPIANLAGSFWQDFNTWETSSVFTETDFRENVTAVTADFDCVVTTDSGETSVYSGWKPDEGPLATPSSFTDSVDVGRQGETTSYPFIYPYHEKVINDYFAVWGASHAEAKASYVGGSNLIGYSRYLQYFNADVVMRRTASWSGGYWRPDGVFRLSPQNYVTPNTTNGTITLKGVGRVSFKLGVSIPYDINKIAYLLDRDNQEIQGSGLTAAVSLESSRTAPTGYSVSYYLVDRSASDAVLYELRVSRVMLFPNNTEQEPTEQTVMELYKWSGSGVTRLKLNYNNASADYYPYGGAIASNKFGLWVNSSGQIVIGATSPNALATSDALFDSSTLSELKLSCAVGSAECRPIFSYVDSKASSGWTAVRSDATVSIPDLETATSASWTTTTDQTNSGRVKIARQTQYGKVTVTTTDASPKSKEFSTAEYDKTCEFVVGRTNTTVMITVDEEATASVFIDDISVSSWQGNDDERNGENRVPWYTDAGFASDTGFAGVGVWIRPESDDQLNVQPSNYTGAQCLLMQRSRQNNTNYSEFKGEDGITHTGSALALYFPYSNAGYGSVSFRYRIPTYDEYAAQSQTTAKTAYVMLQWRDSKTNSRDYRTGVENAAWKNVSGPVELANTGGEWSRVTIKPKYNGAELVGVSGTLRLVMVIPEKYVDDTTYDPYVYIDDVRVTNNEAGSTALWSATNVRVAEEPIYKLYWKDRLATSGAVPTEDTFALKETLTRGVELNNIVSDTETEGSYTTTEIKSPILDNGVGRVTFAARLSEAQAKPVKLWICATESESENAVFTPLTYVEVASTVYTAYDIDFSKFHKYKTKVDANGDPTDEAEGKDFDCSAVKRLIVKAYVEGDGTTADVFGDEPIYGRVLIDQLAIANPVLPSIRVKSVAFSNLPGNNAASEFDARSPLSQPVKGAAALRAMVILDRAQLLKTDSVRVFLTVDPHDHADTSSKLKTFTSGYTYDDVLGGSVSASESHPIYTWDQGALEDWALSSWFDLSENKDKVLGGTLPANTIELTQDESGSLYYYGDLTQLGVNLRMLSENSLVRYNAWAVYQSEDEADETWYATQISANTYTEFPWYFPRSLNAELREKASTEDDPKDSDFFSPYYWVYSYLPGEAFINEFNLADNSNDTKTASAHFIEVCAPTGTSLGGWRIEMTQNGAIDAISDGSISIASGETDDDNNDLHVLPESDTGAVPAEREKATTAQRSFYTAMDSTVAAKLYYYENGEKVLFHEDEDYHSAKNAGISERSIKNWNALGSGLQASSVRLHRPTGGAEHIVCFSLYSEKTVDSETKAKIDQSQENLDKLYTKYQEAYTDSGFGGEWEQTFIDTTWDELSEKDLSNSYGDDAAKMHARRLVKADVFPANADKDNRFDPEATTTAYVNDSANTAYANSIATVDMGGIFVTRKNAINVDVENGPYDLTDVMVGSWDTSNNPTEKTRVTEPEGGTEGLDPVVQVTPCQVNPDQFLVLYSSFSSSVVTSSLEGLGSHAVETFGDTDETTSLGVTEAGRKSPYTWSLSDDVKRSALTYTAFPFHFVTAVSFRVKNAEDANEMVTDAEELNDKVVLVATYTTASGDGKITLSFDDVPEDGWITVAVPDGATTVTLSFNTSDGATVEAKHYSLEAKAAFACDPSGGLARQVITSVSPYCGEGGSEADGFSLKGSAKIQPWWGSNFGFKVGYDEAVLDSAAVLSSVIVTYPAPSALKSAWGVTAAPWSGWSYTTDEVTQSLEGMEYEAALNVLKTHLVPNVGTRYAELSSASEGFFADASAVSILGNTYAKVNGYDPDNVTATADKKEPVIPFCVWGVYTVTVTSTRGTEKVSFLMRQAAPGEAGGDIPTTWTLPDHYLPLSDLNSGITDGGATAPYFYLYSTPPQSAWLNEVNVTAGVDTTADGNAAETPFVEVVFPHLRDGIANVDSVGQAEPSGWSVSRYDANGAETSLGSVSRGTETISGSSSYKYWTMTIAENSSTDKAAYVLKRPCGAGEGGVWVSVDENGNTVVDAPTSLSENAWLLKDTCYVVSGKTDASTIAGSVQLVGKTVWHTIGDYGFKGISSAVEDRTEWQFAATTCGTDNESIAPDSKPVWNQVTITSTLRNATYSGVNCGYQVVPGYFAQEDAESSDDNPTVVTLGGDDWKYDNTTSGVVISYRPRSNYHFESITLPAELIGRVMLVGREDTLPADTVLSSVTTLKQVAELDASRKREWLTLNGRATIETQQVTDSDGNIVDEPTGKITFNLDHVERQDSNGKDVTFGDLDNFVISLVFVEEPLSAQNAIEVLFAQGDVTGGAWLITQTLYALTLAEDGSLTPDPDKGGVAVTLPIWSDEAGNKDGDYQNLHGWLYQPITGDTIGMAAVINPELGLIGSTLSDPVTALTSETATLRPFLVWTAIPEARVPDNLFDASAANAATVTRDAFIKNWSLEKWIGGKTPSVQDNITINLEDLRKTLYSGMNSTQSDALYSNTSLPSTPYTAGIIPMTYTGYCGDGLELTSGAFPEDFTGNKLLAFRTMTAKELEDALANTASGLVNDTVAASEDEENNTEDGDADDDATTMTRLQYTSAIDMTDENLWSDGTVLRFAVVIADPTTGKVYDCQSIGNFSSDAFEAYCPWYIPEASTNINKVTAANENGGVSPFAWIYNIPQGGVWLNEFRPFAYSTVGSAFELAMTASPLKEVTTTKTEYGIEYVETTQQPTRSLDGWKLVTRYAAMPSVTDGSEKLTWTTHKEVPLYGWVPYRRVLEMSGELTDSSNLELDYYTGAPDPNVNTTMDLETTLTRMTSDYLAATYWNTDGSTNADAFQWLNFNVASEGHDGDLFDADLQATLTSGSNAYAERGVLYSIILVRNNGAVEDEVIFYVTSPYSGAEWGSYGETYIRNVLSAAVISETNDNVCAGTVRVVEESLIANSVKKHTAQFYKVTNANTDPATETYQWLVPTVTDDTRIYATLTSPNTMDGANNWSFEQPYMTYEASVIAQRFAVSAYLTGGGSAYLSLTDTSDGDTFKGRSLTAYATVGSEVELDLNAWNDDWYALSTLTRNGADVDPVGTSTATTYSADTATDTPSSSKTLKIASETITEAVAYNLVLTYTEAAKNLEAAGALASTDEAFTAWVQQASPTDIATADTSLSAVERYWLGADSPTSELEVSLNFTAVTTFEDNDNSLYPNVSVCLMDVTDEDVANHTRITELTGDGNVVLLGKESLSDADWTFIQVLASEDLEENKEIILENTDCNFFKAILLSDAEVEAIGGTTTSDK